MLRRGLGDRGGECTDQRAAACDGETIQMAYENFSLSFFFYFPRLLVVQVMPQVGLDLPYMCNLYLNLYYRSLCFDNLI